LNLLKLGSAFSQALPETEVFLNVKFAFSINSANKQKSSSQLNQANEFKASDAFQSESVMPLIFFGS
jgi:hypothetical protein